MKSIFGNSLQVCLFGESHSAAIGVVLNGLPPGVKLDLDLIRHQLDLRRPKGKISTTRQEGDDFKIVSGFFNGHTTGTPLCLMIENTVQRSADYEKTAALLRPSHADFTAYEKYNGFQDYRGGGHFSGRLTAPIVAAGAICIQLLREKGIEIGTHIAALGGFDDTPFAGDIKTLSSQIKTLSTLYFPVLDQEVAAAMIEKIEQVQKEGDSIGGILETAVINLPTGIGEPFFHSIESNLSSLLFSIPGIKGVEFGAGFKFAEKKGSEANDQFCTNNGEIKTATNNNGGINGGISNGMPITIRCAVKPTPSIFKPQQTVNYNTKQEEQLSIKGRHDPAIIHRARVVVDSVVAIGLVDLTINN